jgi:hypothetical protein
MNKKKKVANKKHQKAQERVKAKAAESRKQKKSS